MLILSQRERERMRAAGAFNAKLMDEQGRVQSVCSVEAFGAVRQLARFRLHGTEKDLLACGSDSGRVSVLEYDADRAQFVKLHQETFGKSGCRRIVPGQVRAAHGRATQAVP